MAQPLHQLLLRGCNIGANVFGEKLVQVARSAGATDEPLRPLAAVLVVYSEDGLEVIFVFDLRVG